jgi:hypothetical protein
MVIYMKLVYSRVLCAGCRLTISSVYKSRKGWSYGITIYAPSYGNVVGNYVLFPGGKKYA